MSSVLHTFFVVMSTKQVSKLGWMQTLVDISITKSTQYVINYFTFGVFVIWISRDIKKVEYLLAYDKVFAFYHSNEETDLKKKAKSNITN